jgi:hypothetical protein
MSQSTYGEHDDWFRSTMSYDEREAALFGSSSSGSEYDTEDALSQPDTDDDCVGHVEGATVPSRDRAQSPVTVRYGGPHSPAPRRPRRLAGAIRGCNIGHKDSLESPQTDVLYFLVNPVLYGKSL